MSVKVVSLADAAGRRSAITSRLASLNIKYEIVDAFDARNISESAMVGLVDEKKIKRAHGRDLAKAEVGCALSHLAIYHQILREDLPGAVVLEDDVLVSDTFVDFYEYVTRTASAIRNDRTVIHLGAHGHRFASEYRYYKHSRTICSAHLQLLRPVLPEECWGTFGYYITYAAAKNISEQSRVSCVADNWLGWLGDRKISKILISSPNCVEHPRGAPSSIEVARNVERRKAHPPKGGGIGSFRRSRYVNGVIRRLMPYVRGCLSWLS